MRAGAAGGAVPSLRRLPVAGAAVVLLFEWQHGLDNGVQVPAGRRTGRPRVGDRWTVPLGGGAGKLFKLGKLPVNTSLQAYANVEAPTDGADWQLRFPVQFLFPKIVGGGRDGRSIGHLGLRHARVRTAACPTRPGGEQGSRYLSLTEQGRPDSGELPRPRETPHSDDHGNPGAERRDSRMGTTERQVRREDLAIPAGARPARSRPGARGPVAIRGLVRYNLRRRGSLAGPRPPATPRLRRIIRERRARDGMGGTWCGGRKGPT
jgi:hypothetical protein